jgi:hypothetical protein
VPACPRRRLQEKVGDALSAAQYAEAEELGILVDRDDQARPAFCTSRHSKGCARVVRVGRFVDVLLMCLSYELMVALVYKGQMHAWHAGRP